MVQVLCESDAREWAGRNRITKTRKRRRHMPDQIIRKLAEGHKQLAAGTSLEEVCRRPTRVHPRRRIAAPLQDSTARGTRA